MATSSASSLRQKMRAWPLPVEPGDRPAAQRAVDVDRAAGDDLGAGGDRADAPSRRPRGRRPTGRSAPAGRAAARRQAAPRRSAPRPGRRPAPRSSPAGRPPLISGGRPRPEAEPGRVGALDPDDADVALLQVGDQRRQVRACAAAGPTRRGPRVGPEEAGRALDQGVELGEPLASSGGSGASTSAMKERPRKRMEVAGACEALMSFTTC